MVSSTWIYSPSPGILNLPPEILPPSLYCKWAISSDFSPSSVVLEPKTLVKMLRGLPSQFVLIFWVSWRSLILVHDLSGMIEMMVSLMVFEMRGELDVTGAGSAAEDREPVDKNQVA